MRGLFQLRKIGVAAGLVVEMLRHEPQLGGDVFLAGADAVQANIALERECGDPLTKRFGPAQLIALLEPSSHTGGDLYLRNARHSNAMAQRLRAGVEAGIGDGSISGVAFSQPTQSNGVFATLPDGVADELRKAFRFYDWDAAKNEVRWMCSFDTTADDVDAFVAELARLT